MCPYVETHRYAFLEISEDAYVYLCVWECVSGVLGVSVSVSLFMSNLVGMYVCACVCRSRGM